MRPAAQAYYLRLKVKDQVVMFNYLLDQQVQMVQKLHMSWMQVRAKRLGCAAAGGGLGGGGAGAHRQQLEPDRRSDTRAGLPQWAVPRAGTNAGACVHSGAVPDSLRNLQHLTSYMYILPLRRSLAAQVHELPAVPAPPLFPPRCRRCQA